MGIHHDYKSKRGERAMAKQEKRESKFSDKADKKEEERKEKLSSALRANLQKRKIFQKKINNKDKNL